MSAMVGRRLASLSHMTWELTAKPNCNRYFLRQGYASRDTIVGSIYLVLVEEWNNEINGCTIWNAVEIIG